MNTSFLKLLSGDIERLRQLAQVVMLPTAEVLRASFPKASTLALTKSRTLAAQGSSSDHTEVLFGMLLLGVSFCLSPHLLLLTLMCIFPFLRNA